MHEMLPSQYATRKARIHLEKIRFFSENVIKEVRLKDKVVSKGSMHVKITKNMCGLPHPGIIAQKLLEKRLRKEGCF